MLEMGSFSQILIYSTTPQSPITQTGHDAQPAHRKNPAVMIQFHFKTSEVTHEHD
jgi:hypothetical protein